jgi:hypothetical protein
VNELCTREIKLVGLNNHFLEQKTDDVQEEKSTVSLVTMLNGDCDVIDDVALLWCAILMKTKKLVFAQSAAQ